MKASRFSEEQIIHLLQQAACGEQAANVLCREHGISEQTFYRRRQTFGGMTVPDSRRFRELSKENARLKRLLAEPDLEVDALEAWMAEATHSGIPELARFARGLQDDLNAIQAGLTLAWSNGVTEGHVHRLKLVKRQGYGRAGFAHLRQRVLQAA
jgi:putative transposase